MNPLDITVAVILLIFGYLAYRKGLLLSLFGLVSMVLSLFLANLLYPMVGRFLRTVGVYDSLQASIAKSLGLQDLVKEQTLRAQTELINALPFPSFLQNAMLANNNPEVYKLLKVDSIEAYISGYIANMIVNILSLILVFVLVMILIKVLSGILDLVSRLPVIHSFNKLGGICVGLLQGTLLIWILFIGATMFLSTNDKNQFFTLLDSSRLASFLYQKNVLLDMVLRVVA